MWREGRCSGGRRRCGNVTSNCEIVAGNTWDTWWREGRGGGGSGGSGNVEGAEGSYKR